MKKFLKLNTILLFVQSILFFIIYSSFIGSGLNDMYTHKWHIFIVFAGLILYFIPTFVASAINKKYFLQIFLLNAFLGFTFIGWLGALIWATFKTENKENYNKIITIILQIICSISFLCFCITDYKMFNYDTVNQKQNAQMQILLEYMKK